MKAKETLSHLIQLNFAITTIVKQIEGLLKFCNENKKNIFENSFVYQIRKRKLLVGFFLWPIQILEILNVD